MIAILVAALVVLTIGGYAVSQKSYYRMAGEVAITDKSQTGSDYYIVIEEATGEQFTL